MPKKKINPLLNVFDNLSSQKKLLAAFSEKQCVHIKGLVGSGLSFRFAAAFQKQDQSLLFIHENAELAAYFLNDFERLVGKSKVLFFQPAIDKPMLQKLQTMQTSYFEQKS